MDLVKSEIVASVYYTGRESFILLGRDRIRFQKKAKGSEWVDFLDEKVPNKKKWRIEVTISAAEEDK